MNSETPGLRTAEHEEQRSGDEVAVDGQTRDIVRAKGVCDGAATLGAAATMLRAYADYLTKREREGWYLEAPVHDDTGVMRRSGD